MKLGVILPTRGLPFSTTMEEIIRELKNVGLEWELFWAHGKPVPEAFNISTESALKDESITHLWHVDDDMALPKGILEELLLADAHAIAADYPVGRMGTVMYDPEGKAFFTGAGCLLVKREVYDDMKRPIWRTDVSWKLHFKQDHIVFEAGSANPDKVYGQQDVNLGLRLYLQGRPIKVTHTTCGHRRLMQYGDKSSNSGVHTFSEMWAIHKNAYYSNETHTGEGELTTVKLSDGNYMQVTPDHAKRLFERGAATQIGYAIFTNWDINKEEVLS